MRQLWFGLQRSYNYLELNAYSNEEFSDFCKDATFRKAFEAFNNTLNRNAKVNPVNPVKKAQPTSFAAERTILNSRSTAIDHPDTLLRRVFYQLWHRFALRGCEETYNLLLKQFHLGTDRWGPYIE